LSDHTATYRRQAYGTWLERYIERFEPLGLDAEPQQRARQLLIGCLLAPLALLGYGLWFWLSYGAWQGLVAYGSAAAVIGLVVPPYLARTGHIDRSAHLILASGMSSMACVAYLRGGFPWSTLTWILVGPAVGVFVFARRGPILAWAGVAMATILFFWIAEVRFGGIEPVVVFTPEASIRAGFGSLLGVLVFMVLVVRPSVNVSREFGEQRDDLRARLERAQRLESLGRMSGEIAHDFRNVLSAVGGSALLLQEKCDQDDPCRPDVDAVAEAAERGRDMTEQLLAFARQSPAKPQPTSIDERVLSIRSLMQRILSGQIQIATELAGDGATVLIDPSQLDRVLLNLATNARDAMPDGGTLEFRTRTVRFEAGATAPVAMSPGRYVELTVTDTGAGMTPDVAERVFEPFFTTKEGGMGTGLGLSSSYGIVAQAGGQITVDSKPGRGARFRLYLPVEGDAAALLRSSERVIN